MRLFLLVLISSHADAGTNLRKIWLSDETSGITADVETSKELAVTVRDIDTGKNLQIESNGAAAVNIQDQHTPAFDAFFSQAIAQTTLSVAGVIDEYTVTLTGGHGALVGEQLLMYDSASDRVYVGNILVVATNLITLDTPLNIGYPTATTTVVRTTNDMVVDGSVTRETFVFNAPVTESVDVVRVMFQMTTTNPPELDMFGDIVGGLTRGLVLRVVNSRTTNLFNVKTNGELVNLMYDVQFYEADKVFGVNGLGGRLTYGGQSKHGVTLRLDPGDSIEAIIQDDLTDGGTILTFRMIAAGHIVTD